MSDSIPDEWYFITPPQNVSWSKDSRSTIVETYGTNNPYVHYGTTKLRTLTLGDALIEGFSDGDRIVEENITDLEACMRMVLDSESGYAAPYVWHVYAGGKSYGNYVITSVNVSESIRAPSGLAVRAKVDVSLQQVSPYQVSSGIDISADALTGSINPNAQKELEKQTEANKQEDKINNNNKNNNNSNKDNNTSGGGKGSGSTGNPTQNNDPPAIGGDVDLGI